MREAWFRGNNSLTLSIKSSTMKKLLPLLVILMLFSAPLFSQDWLEMMKDRNANVHDVQTAFYAWYARQPADESKTNRGPEEDADGLYRQFRRWEWMMEARTFPTGNRPNLNQLESDYKGFMSAQRIQRKRSMQAASNWSYTGNTSVPTGGGAGRVNYFRFMPGNSNTIFACTPTGGLWKTTNGGTSWATQTDNLLTDLSVSDIAINPLDTNVMYISIGDGDGIGGGYTTLSTVGVLKSIDGGNSWNATGLNYAQATTGPTSSTVNQLLMHPTDTALVLSATSFGLFRTTNGGISWTNVNAGDYKSVEYEPFHPSTIYAGTNDGQFFRSVDTGATWTLITAGLPVPASGKRMKVAVSPSDSNTVYVLEWNKGTYRSTDRGQTFTQQSTFDPIGGQGWYDIGFNASPTNKDSLIAGGLDNYCSADGGVTWNQITSWTASGHPYVHADVHCISWIPGSGFVYFVSCDGGIFKYNVNNPGIWTDISSNLEIAEIYSVGPSFSTAGLWITGWQDNGTSLSQPIWIQALGGDGMVAFIDESNDNNLFAEYFDGQQNFSSNGGFSWSNVSAPLASAWVTPWMQDPMNPNRLYSVTSQVEESNDKGSTWNPISSWSPGIMSAEAVDAHNDQIMAAATPGQIEYTVNNGTSWTDITNGLPVSSAGISGIAIDPYKPSHIYVTFSGYTATAKVFMSSNSGATWTNISAGLPNLPVNCILLPSTVTLGNEGIYVGTDRGVYYHDTISGWMSFNNNLPNVIVNDLKYAVPTGTILAATYGRGIWSSPAVITGVNNLTENNSIAVYPSPTNGLLNVKLELPDKGTYALTLTNLLGQIMYTENIELTGAYSTTIDMSNFAKGSYVLSIRGQNNQVVRKVVLQ
jgi:hypothetical protein